MRGNSRPSKADLAPGSVHHIPELWTHRYQHFCARHATVRLAQRRGTGILQASPGLFRPVPGRTILGALAPARPRGGPPLVLGISDDDRAVVELHLEAGALVHDLCGGNDASGLAV